MFSLLQKHKLYVEAEKCALFLEKVEFLGHTISKEGVSVDQGKLTAVQSWPVPTTLTQL